MFPKPKPWFLAAVIGVLVSAPPLLGAPVVRWSITEPGHRWIGTAVLPSGDLVAAAASVSNRTSGQVLFIGADGTRRTNVLLSGVPAWPPMATASGAAAVVTEGGHLILLSGSGEVLWTRAVPGSGAAPFAASDGSVGLAVEPAGEQPRRFEFWNLSGQRNLMVPINSSTLGDSPPPRHGLRLADGVLAHPGGSSLLGLLLPPSTPWLSSSGAGLAHSMAPLPGLELLVAGPQRLTRLAADGGQRWTVGLSNLLTSPVVAPDGRILIGDGNRGLLCLGPDGGQLWSTANGVAVAGTPACLSNGSVAFGADDGRVRVVNAAGQTAWEYLADAPVRTPVSVLPGGDLVVGSVEGTLYCLAGDTPLAGTGWPKWQGDPANSGVDAQPATPPAAVSGLAARDAGNVLVRWSSGASARRYRVRRLSSDPALPPVVFPETSQARFVDRSFTETQPVRYEVTAWNALGESAPAVSETLVPRRRQWQRTPVAGLRGLVELTNSTVIVTGTEAGNRGAVVALGRDGQELWRWRSAGAATWVTAPLVDREGRIVMASGRDLVTLNPDGTVLSVLALDVEPNAGLALGLGNEIFALGSSAGSSGRLSIADRALRRVILTGQVPAVAGRPLWAVHSTGHVLFNQGSTLRVYSPNLALLWQNISGIGAPLPGGVVLVHERERLARYTVSGQLLSESPVPAAGLSGADLVNLAARRSAVVGQDGTAWIGRDSSVVRWSPNGQVTTILPGSESAGVVRSLALGSDGRLVVERTFTVDLHGPDGTYLESLHLHGPAASAGTIPLVLTRDQRLLAGSEAGEVLCVTLPFGLDTSAYWPLNQREPGGTRSLIVPSTEPPAPAQGLTAVTTLTGVRLRWNPGGDRASQEILRGSNADPAAAVLLTNLDPRQSMWDDPAHVPGSAPRYWIRARHESGPATLVGPITPPPAPTVAGRLAAGSPFFGRRLAISPTGRTWVCTGGSRVLSGAPDGTLLGTNQLPGVDFVGLPILSPTGTIRVANPSRTARISPDGTYLESQPHEVLALFGGDRELRRDSAGRHWVVSAAGPDPDLTAAGTGARFLAVVGADDTLTAITPDHQLVRLTADNHELWRLRLQPAQTLNEIAADGALDRQGTLYFFTARTGLSAVDAGGQLRWTRPEEPIDLVLGQNGTVLVRQPLSGGPAVLTCLDAATGNTRWTYQASTVLGPATATLDGTIILPTVAGLLGLSESDGSVRWAMDLTNPPGSIPSRPGLAGVRLADNGTLAVQVLGDVFTFQLSTRPADSGWPMVGHDGGNSAYQGARGSVGLSWEAVEAPGDEGLHLQLRSGSPGAFITLESEDLIHWRYPRPPSGTGFPVLPQPGTPGTPGIRVPVTGGAPARFWRALTP